MRHYVLIDLNIKRIGMDGPYSQSLASTVVNSSPSVSDGRSPSPVRGGELTGTVPWHIRALAFFTMYSELCAANTPEDFAQVCTSCQREWSFDGSFVSQFAIIFFKLDSQLIHHQLLGLAA